MNTINITLKAFKPKHPSTIVIKPNEFYSKGLTEQNVWRYYDSVKDQLVDWYTSHGLGAMLFVYIDGTVVRRVGEILSASDFDKYNNGRTIEFHYNLGKNTNFLFIDLDPKEQFPFEEVKVVASELLSELKSMDNVKEVQANFSGHVGMHLYCFLKKAIDVDEGKEILRELLEEYLKEKDDSRLKIGIQKDPKGMRLDISTLHVKGGLRCPYSLNGKTGLVCMSVSDVLKFKKEDAVIGIKKESEDKALPIEEGYKGRYVIQRHFAKRAKEHFDFRLEVPEGNLEKYEEKRNFEITPEPEPAKVEVSNVLASWAIPKHKLPEKGERILAVRTEDHPVDYIDFEGNIPEGQYGAGKVEIYSKGTFEVKEITDKKVKFVLKDEKEEDLGTFSLIKTRKEQWMMVKS